MSLRSKIVLILSVVVLLFAALDHTIQQNLIFKSFVKLEEREARRDVIRVVQALEAEIQHLDRHCDELAAWDDTWRFVAKPNQAFVESNLGVESLRKHRIHLLYVCDVEGRVVWGRILDVNEDQPISLRDFPGEELSLKHPLIQSAHPRADPLIADAPPVEPRPGGIWMTERGPMLASAMPILDGHHQGPSRGTVILGRFMSEEFLQDLRERTGVEFEVWPLESSSLPAEVGQVLDQVTAATEPVVREKDAEKLHVLTTFADTKAAPSLLIRAEVDRHITTDGGKAVRYALISTVAAGLLIMLVLLNLLQRTVLKPLAMVTEHAVGIGRSDETFRKLDLDRTDEIGVLSREFDRMMEKLSESRAALVVTARAAGMSEIATAVLHNIGNVLNSVNVSATLVSQRASGTSAEDLLMAMKAVQDSAGDLATFLANDPRGKHLQPLLASLAEQMASDQGAIREEMKNLSRGIEHIQELVRSQQDYAGRAGVLEATELSDPIESALSMTARPGGSEIQVVREFDDVPPCAVDRHKLTEILVNLVQNAREAMLEAPASEKRLAVRLRRPAPGRIQIEVEDDGVGIAPENLERIFTHGFTTKKTGHGFGLHASANAAREMGGSLVARCEGVGRGATFLLELPVREVPGARRVGART